MAQRYHLDRKMIVETAPNGTDSYGPVHHLMKCEEYYHVTSSGPCNWDVLVTDQGIFYRPDTYWFASPYGWRRLF